MKRLMIAAALLACACTPPAADAPEGATPHEGVSLPMADAAGNRMEALSEQNGRWCTSDGAWCAVLGESEFALMRGEQDVGVVPRPAIDSHESLAVWPVIAREARDEGAIVGLTRSRNEMYSGGGGNTSYITLYQVQAGSLNAPEVLTFQSGGSFSIRACFDEDDRQARRDACSDEYIFGGDLALDEANASGPPRLVLQTTATTYPGRRSRLSSDSTTEAPLQESDLVTAADPDCSYRRVLTFNGTAYEYDTPPPACEDYQTQ